MLKNILTERVNFILPFGLDDNFHITVRPGTQFRITVRPRTRFHITVPEFFASGEYSVICEPPYRHYADVAQRRIPKQFEMPDTK
jgi:hypothetical protein